VANNIWTYGQQHLVFGRIEKRETAQKEETLQRRAANAPAPGAKPNRNKKPIAAASDSDVESGDAEEPDDGGPSKPAPGARPQNKKR
jgi:YidC/Oxa1 family membrane protein insertase